MKRLLLSILMVVIGLSAFSQSPSRLISLTPAYPVAIGESAIDDVVFSNGVLNLSDIELDSLPQYEIRYIDTQTFRYSEMGYGFYVKADSLHSLNVVYSYDLSEQPQGEIKFNEATGRFKYYPTPDEYKRFYVTFTATNGTESISEKVEFCPMPLSAPEAEIFDSEGKMPDAGDYITIAETPASDPLGTEERSGFDISLSGKDIIFDNAVKNKVWGLNGREDINEMNIYAERLIIRSALRFPGSDINIHAKEVIYEDNGSEIASINTTPISTETLTNGAGSDGANAGNINLYIKEFRANIGLRFISNGAKGQSTNRNGTPGNGGNGGTIRSTIDINSYCDLARGSGGIKYDVSPDGSTTAGPIIGCGAIGSDGHFILINNPNAYLHPYYIAAVIRHANDAFINNYTEYALQVCSEYRKEINAYLDTADEDEIQSMIDLGIDVASGETAMENILGFKNELLEIDKMLFKLEQGLDYFGNPKGWVPLLSFEVYLKNYDNEIGRAIPTLYMYYWMNRIDRTLQEKVRASQEAAIQTEQEMDSNIELLNSLTLEVPILEDEAEEINRMVQDLTIRIEILQNQLMAKAIKNVKKRNRLKKLFGIGNLIAKVLPIFGTPGKAIGSGLSTVLSIASSGVNYLTGMDYYAEIKDVGEKCDEQFFNNLKTSLTSAKTSVSQKDFKGLTAACKSMYETASPLINNIQEAYNVLSKGSAPNSEVQAEYNKLIASSPEWNSMKAQVDELNVKKNELLNHINQVFSDMTTTISDVSNNVLALDAFRRDAFKGNSKRDLNAMLYLERMEQRAKNRLLLYDYYLRKAYEYRLLQAYNGEEFNLNGMFDRLETLGLALDSVVNVPAYNTLSSIYKERVSDMTHKIIEEYTYNQPEKSTKFPIIISKDQLDAINANGSVTLNLYELDKGSYFFQDEENIRIVNLGVKHIKAHAVGNASRSRLALDMKHSGMSQYRKNGRIYWFDHMSRNNDNPHFWRTTIDFNDVAEETYPETHQNSVAISSLLSSILNNNIESVMLFSRPSVWSDITMSKLVQTNGDDVVIDSLVLELQYDYTLRPDNIRNIDVTANNDLMPYIASSAEDISGKGSGYGPLYRSYRTSSQPITFTAVDKYETYYFKNWTDRSGKVVSDKTDLTVNRQKDQFYIANYERRVPILSAPDTITIHESNENNEYIVHVGNIGSGDMEMDWYVSDSLSNCVYLKGVAKGIDEGSFTFSFNSVPNELDSLEIFAPETDMMSKKIYIAVDDDIKQAIADKMESIAGSYVNVRVSPNPMRDYVKIEGEGLLSVSIYSITGKEMYRSGIGGSHSATINVAGLPIGVYIISVKTRDGMISKKLLKTN